MMSTLADRGICLRRERPGEHRAACPRCAEIKIRPRDEALAVKVDPDGSAAWYCHRCGWRGSTRAPGSPQEHRKGRAEGCSLPSEPGRRSTGLPRAAAGLRRSCRAITGDCPAGRYLTARGCALPHPDGDLAWHPELPHPSGHVGPGLVALVTDAVTGEALTLHRTWVQPGGTKAPVDKPRLLWPGQPKAGGVVRLWPDAEVAFGLCVAEGIETALTAAIGFQPAWACIDAANLAAFPVLPGIEALTIVADHDTNGVGQRAAEECARRWAEAGIEAMVWANPTPGGDLNDYRRAVA